MCSWWSSASRIRSTAACMFGSRNGSLNDFKRGCRKRSTSSALAKPLRINSRAMQGEPHISAHENGPPFSSSGDAMIHRLCTDQLIRGELPDKMQCSRSRLVLITLDSQTLVNNSGDITNLTRVSLMNKQIYGQRNVYSLDLPP